ncbi:toll/interleukin-1 receptor domain-containing protein [Thiohalophilus sp.]|uniref:toll/interleukin-1 receptor domain-containing protein n=1 Tax=Thiohalophilus sp. TaxID=3028392 RepID=UPI002ACDDFC9|nr:toll/interleukin-1 receptor domain-containing protein [Thiohalophilus sp.]MDZ7662950.1 toll/interleukin-1 receptor domain-containing protein [Thiohalophilus sp.]
MDIFISHISSEAPLAKILKEWIESTFSGGVRVFVSSDSDDIPAGSKWLDKISQALSESKILILLCSSASVIKPWINFEAGAGWAKNVPIMPVCHSPPVSG